jgi:mRNA interferase MazF
MLTSGDVVDLDLGLPEGREAGFRHPAVVVTAQPILRRSPSVVQIVPLTSTLRDLSSEVAVAADPHNGLDRTSAAQCQHVRSVSVRRVLGVRGNVGPTCLAQLRETLGILLDVG